MAGFCFYLFMHGISPGMNYPEKFTYYLHTGGLKYSEQEVYSGDEIHDQLVRWLESNPDGWKLTFTTYVPIQMFYSDDLTVNVTINAVVVKYSSLGGVGPSLQVYKEIDSPESVLGKFADQ